MLSRDPLQKILDRKTPPPPQMFYPISHTGHHRPKYILVKQSKEIK